MWLNRVHTDERNALNPLNLELSYLRFFLRENPCEQVVVRLDDGS